jgi:hypothetical protein
LPRQKKVTKEKAKLKKAARAHADRTPDFELPIAPLNNQTSLMTELVEVHGIKNRLSKILNLSPAIQVTPRRFTGQQ